MELLEILEELQNSNEDICSDSSYDVIPDKRLMVKVNEPELRRDFEEFCRRMRIKWYFRNEISKHFSEVPAFSPKSSWEPPQGHPNLEVHLSQVENKLFSIADEHTRYSAFKSG